MKIEIIFILLSLLLLNGCETGHGYERRAKIDKIPDLIEFKKVLESYPEIKRVDFLKKKYSEMSIFNFFYTNYDLIEGNLSFWETTQGMLSFHYRQGDITFYPLQTRVQEKADTTWPIIKRIESDLVDKFGIRWLEGGVKTELINLRNPERNRRITNDRPTQAGH
jgi:hypothetical protein